jgi:hypothetical protein
VCQLNCDGRSCLVGFKGVPVEPLACQMNAARAGRVSGNPLLVAICPPNASLDDDLAHKMPEINNLGKVRYRNTPTVTQEVAAKGDYAASQPRRATIFEGSRKEPNGWVYVILGAERIAGAEEWGKAVSEEVENQTDGLFSVFLRNPRWTNRAGP